MADKESLIVILLARLESILPFDFGWLEVLVEEIEELRRDFAWRKLGEKILGLAFSVFIIYLFWDFIGPIRAMMRGFALMIAQFYISIFLLFLPISLFFSSLEFIGVVINFIGSPSKKKVKVLWHSTWICGGLWLIYLADHYFHSYIEAFVEMG